MKAVTFQAFLPEARKTSTTARTSFENVTSLLNLQLTLLNLNCLSCLGKKKKKKMSSSDPVVRTTTEQATAHQ